MAAMHYGIDVGGTKIEFAVFDGRFEKLDDHRIDTITDDYQGLVDTLVGLVRNADSTYGNSSSVGIGINGIVDAAGCSFSANVPCINGKHVSTDLGNSLGRPVQCLNDVRAFAMSEAIGGAGQNYRTMVAVVLGTGVMGTLCVDGKIQSGASGIAGEWGHLPIAATLVERHQLPMLPCACGQMACAECYVSGPGLERLAAHYLGAALDPRDCVARARRGQEG